MNLGCGGRAVLLVVIEVYRVVCRFHYVAYCLVGCGRYVLCSTCRCVKCLCFVCILFDFVGMFYIELHVQAPLGKLFGSGRDPLALRGIVMTMHTCVTTVHTNSGIATWHEGPRALPGAEAASLVEASCALSGRGWCAPWRVCGRAGRSGGRAGRACWSLVISWRHGSGCSKCCGPMMGHSHLSGCFLGAVAFVR